MARTPLLDIDAAIRSGHFAEAGVELASQSDAKSLIYRARLAFFSGDFDEAARTSARAAELSGDDRSTRLLAEALRSCALVALGRPSQQLRAVDVNAGLRDASLIGYYAATAAYWRRDYDAARDWLGFFPPKLPELRARYLVLQGLVAAACGQMKSQLKFTESALDLLEADAPKETYLIAFCAHIIALLLRELAQRGALGRLERLEKRLAWAAGLESMHFQVLRTIGWSYALNSEFVPALTHISRAAMLLNDSVSRIYSHLDRATVSIFALERTGAQADFTTAHGPAKSIDWKSMRTEGIAVLPLAAATAAELQLTREARSLLALAESTAGQMAPFWALAHGPRMRGFIAESQALTDAGHNHKAAIDGARRAFAIFDDIGYQWRAGRMATLLLTLTGEKTWRAEAERALAGYSRSPYASALVEQTRSGLTVRQQEVLRLTLEGKSGAEIAEELEISIYTVYNHQAEIKRVKGARTVTALVASDGAVKRKRARKVS